MRAKHLKMASSMGLIFDSDDDDDLLRPSIATKPWTVTPDMMESVLAVCPHASREEIKSDLSQTHSVTTTINRILDGEVSSKFPFQSGSDNHSSTENKDQHCVPSYSCASNTAMQGVVNAVSTLEDKNSVNNSVSLSDTDIDTDEDDDVVIVKEEREKIFTLLRERLKEKSTCTSANAEVLRDTKDFDHVLDENMSNSLRKTDGKRKEKAKSEKRHDNGQTNKTTRTSDIQDISFTDNFCEKMEVDQNSDDEIVFLSVENQKSCIKSQTNFCKSKQKDLHNTSEIIDLSFVDDDKHESDTSAFSDLINDKNATDGLLHKQYNIQDTSIDFKRQQDETMQSSKHPKKNPSKDNFCLKMDSDDNSDICEARMTDVSASESESDDLPSLFPSVPQCSPKKRRKQNSEENSKRKEEMKMLKEAKENEKRKKKEVAEREKQEKNQVMQMKKREREIEKLNKKAKKMDQSSQRKEESMQAMEVCIDPDLLSSKAAHSDDIDPLIVKLTSLGVSYTLMTQPIPASITWKRATVEHKVGNDLQIEIHKTYSDEGTVIVRMGIEGLISLVELFKKDHSSGSRVARIESFLTNLRDTYRNKIINLVILGVDRYFRDIKAKQTRQFKNAVRGDTSDQTKSKSRKDPQNTSVMVSKVEVEELLVYMELQSNIKITMCESTQDFAELVGMFTKAVAEAPFKKSQPSAFSFCVDAGNKPPVKVTKDGEGFLKLWQQQLQQYHNVSANMAAAIVSVYPSPQLLVQAYRQCANEKSAAMLLKDIVVRRGEGALATSRRIGPELSRQIYTLFNATDGQTLTK